MTLSVAFSGSAECSLGDYLRPKLPGPCRSRARGQHQSVLLPICQWHYQCGFQLDSPVRPWHHPLAELE